jgi:hypothetical protein
MTTQERIEFQREWQSYLDKQAPHEWLMPVRVRWDMPWDERGAVMELGRRRCLNEDKLDAVLSEAAATDPWQDDTYLIDREFVAMAGCEFTPTGEPITAWTGVDGVSTVKTLVQARQSLINTMGKDVFNLGWISEHWRGPFIRLCRAHLANPGVMLTLMVLGGNRLGKTYTVVHLLMCNFAYPVRPPGQEMNPDWDARIICAHETDDNSCEYHHPLVYKFLPNALRPADGRKLSNQERKHGDSTGDSFNFDKGKFVNDKFSLVKEIDGRRHGGNWQFRNYHQKVDSWQSGEANCIFLDELVPQEHFDTTPGRVSSRTDPTKYPEYREKITRLLAMLESGTPMQHLPRELLGAMAHGVRFWTVTPINGFSASVRTALAAVKYAGWKVAPILKALFKPADSPDYPAEETWQVEGGQKVPPDWLVPTHGSTPDPTFLIELLPTSMNIWKPAYHSQISSYKHSGRKSLTLRLYGYVRGDYASDFTCYDESMHVAFNEWAGLSHEGTLYEFIDEAPSKPWTIIHALIDPRGVQNVLQEWPCWWKNDDGTDNGIPINGDLRTQWAKVSTGDRWNGDEGEAQDLRLGWSEPEYCRQIWQLRKRIVDEFKKIGRDYKGKTWTGKLEWPLQGAHWTLEGTFAIPEWTVGDPVWSPMADDGKRVGEDETESLQDRMYFTMAKEAPGTEIWIGRGERGSDIGVRIQRISSWLSRSIVGRPAMRINRQCGNLRFALSTFSTPAYRKNTKSNDEACKDPIDAMGYGNMRELRFVDSDQPFITDSGRR